MARSLSAKDIIRLPRLSAGEAAVLITELLTAADVEAKAAPNQQLPPVIERSRKRLITAHTALGAVLQPQAEEDTLAKRRADRALDTAWSGTFDWLAGWCKLPASAHPSSADAKALFSLLFEPDNLGFTKLRYKLQWQESQSRLEAIEREKHEATFTALGGAPFLATLKDAHTAYGAALHITTRRPDSDGNPEVRAALDGALSALRDYAMRVGAYPDPEEPGSEELAAELLKPLVKWESAPPITDPKKAPGTETPKPPAAETPKPPVAETPKPAAAQAAKTPAAEKPKAAAIEKPKAAAVEAPKAAAVETSKAAAADGAPAPSTSTPSAPASATPSAV